MLREDATIGSSLLAKRRELGLEQSRAAEKIGMSRSTYSSYELDHQRPSADVLPAIADFIGISLDELLVLYGATCIALARPALARVLEQRVQKAAEPEPIVQSAFVATSTSIFANELSSDPVAPPTITTVEFTPEELKKISALRRGVDATSKKKKRKSKKKK